MKDRVPGAPGQYKAVVTEAELQKMHAGEQFAITMTRDDQPIVEGTPYSKAAVLPDALATQLCPGIADPTPADALAALLPKSGGAMTGSLDMGGKSIFGCSDISTGYINGARIRAYDFSNDNIPFVIDRGGHSAYLVVGRTNSGVCVYALGIDQGGLGVEAIKICGGEYATLGFTADDTRSITIHGSQYAVCYVVSIDNWNV